MLEFKKINHNEAVVWLTNNNNLKLDEFHKSFDFWIQHIFYARHHFPELKKFIKSTPNWVGAYKDDNLIAVHYYTIKDKQMYDGFLISDPRYAKEQIGLKLSRFLFTQTKHVWEINYSIAMKDYIAFNKRLGYEIIRKAYITGKFQTEAYLIKRSNI
tara:strand:+ start:45 stop:515 length:471 start_codon:yes stop_codon:yes gene_type:complete